MIEEDSKKGVLSSIREMMTGLGGCLFLAALAIGGITPGCLTQVLKKVSQF